MTKPALAQLSERQLRRRRKRGIPPTDPALSGPARTTLTQKELAALHDLPLSTLKKRMRKGLHDLHNLLRPSRNKAKPVTIDGVAYSSTRAAARATGMSEMKVASVRDCDVSTRVDTVGRGMRQPMDEK